LDSPDPCEVKSQPGKNPKLPNKALLVQGSAPRGLLATACVVSYKAVQVVWMVARLELVVVVMWWLVRGR
jgi:hypothetical protein